MERKWNPKTGLLLWGGVLGLVAAALAFMGNPGNMAFCIACFIRILQVHVSCIRLRRSNI